MMQPPSAAIEIMMAAAAAAEQLSTCQKIKQMNVRSLL
jgi:hypothetical protein